MLHNCVRPSHGCVYTALVQPVVLRRRCRCSRYPVRAAKSERGPVGDTERAEPAAWVSRGNPVFLLGASIFNDSPYLSLIALRVQKTSALI